MEKLSYGNFRYLAPSLSSGGLNPTSAITDIDHLTPLPAGRPDGCNNTAIKANRIPCPPYSADSWNRAKLQFLKPSLCLIHLLIRNFLFHFMMFFGFHAATDRRRLSPKWKWAPRRGIKGTNKNHHPRGSDPVTRLRTYIYPVHGIATTDKVPPHPPLCKRKALSPLFFRHCVAGIPMLFVVIMTIITIIFVLTTRIKTGKCR